MAGKYVLVTGGTRGIGKGVAERFLTEGSIVTIVGRHEDEAKKTVEELSAIGEIDYQIADLGKPETAEQVVEDFVARKGRIDILVNVAGIQIRKWATDFSIEEFNRVLDVNLKSYYFASRTAFKYMRKQGGGSIVCISSGNSNKYTSRRSAYNIAKTAVNGLVGTLAVEWARFGVRINGVAPGYVATEMIKHGVEEGIIDVDSIMSVTPMKRMMSPEEIGNCVVFLASDEASGVTGQTLFCDGGWDMCALPEPEVLPEE